MRWEHLISATNGPPSARVWISLVCVCLSWSLHPDRLTEDWFWPAYSSRTIIYFILFRRLLQFMPLLLAEWLKMVLSFFFLMFSSMTSQLHFCCLSKDYITITIWRQKKMSLRKKKKNNMTLLYFYCFILLLHRLCWRGGCCSVGRAVLCEPEGWWFNMSKCPWTLTDNNWQIK